MSTLSLDTETARFRPGRMAPELACLTYAGPVPPAGILHWRDAELALRAWLEDPSLRLVGHFAAYDMAVICAQFPDLIPLIFRAYRENRVTDTKVRQQLLDIAAGCFRGRFGEGNRWITFRYDLGDLARRFLKKQLDKDTHRLTYGELRDLPLSEWPEGAITYAKEDAQTTLDIHDLQEHHAEFLADQYRQTRASFWLHLSSVWGLRTTDTGVEQLRAATEEAREEVAERLRECGLVRPDGTRDTKAAKMRMVQVCAEECITPRLTGTGGISLDGDACAASGDEVLKDYAEYSTLNYVLSKDVPALAAGTSFPVHTRYDLAESGRTTSSNPPIQNLRRLAGIRECFVPRAGRVFMQADYPQLELFTLAQTCVSLFGQSRLAEALNAGLDPHSAVAADILGIPYEEVIANKENKDRPDVENARQTAKVANFGFPGGLGAAKLVLFARKTYKVILTEDRARQLKEQWLTTWPEMRLFFEHVGNLCNRPDGLGMVEQLFVDRVRGGARFCAACNTFFQGLGADASKEAGWRIAEAMYSKPGHPLYGSRTVAYIHDEFIAETDDGPGAHDAAEAMSDLMVSGANVYLPDVPIPRAKVKPLLMRVWSKGAKRLVDGNGRLIPWAPVEKAA